MLQKRLKSVEWKHKKSRIEQIYTEGLEYALVTTDYRQIHQFVYCKDFMQDAIQAFLNNIRISIWSFIYDSSLNLPIHLDSIRLLVSNAKDKDFRFKIEYCSDFINQFESHLRMSKTKICECKDPLPNYRRAGVWLFNGSRRWLRSPPMVSLYTLLIRIGLVHKIGTDFRETLDGVQEGFRAPYGERDQEFLAKGRRGIDWILEYGDRKVFPKDIKANYTLRYSNMGNARALWNSRFR